MPETFDAWWYERTFKDNRYNLTLGLLEESQLANVIRKRATKYVGNKRIFCRLNPTTPSEDTKNAPKWLWQLIRSVSKPWLSLPFGLPPLKKKLTGYISVQFKTLWKCSNSCFHTTSRQKKYYGTKLYQHWRNGSSDVIYRKIARPFISSGARPFVVRNEGVFKWGRRHHVWRYLLLFVK
jgi:hypothetical protein